MRWEWWESMETTELDGKEMQGVLLADLETRLQPVNGMIDALGNEAGP